MGVSSRVSARSSVSSVVVVGAFLVATGCGQGPPELTQAEGEAVARVAEPVAGDLLQTLVGRLTQALEEGGAVHAVEFCSAEAVPLTQSVEEAHGEGVSVKRASFRYRNPGNAPDDAEELALRYFEDALLGSGEVPSHYVQRVSEREMRYYKPLFVGQVCLQCHGLPEAIAPEVLEVLATKYPGDLATGYAAGDFRGVVRVSVPAEAVQGPG